MNNIVPLADITQMAEVAAGSRMFGFKNSQEAMAIMLLCQAENLHPAVAMRDYHVIQGRPALKADAMLARFQQAGGSVNWKDYTDDKVTGVFSHPAGGSLEVSWSLAQAKSIGIANKDNWRNYPRAMLRARCVSEGIRSVYPGCVVGVYTPEEVEDFKPSKPIEMGIAERVENTEQLENLEDGPFKLMVPGVETPYSHHHTPEEFIDAYGKLIRKVATNSKLSPEEKEAKMFNLARVNEPEVENFGALLRMKLKATIAECGGNPLPKDPLILEETD